jgi:multicomponent Na+:H+ antiporter subunit C
MELILAIVIGGLYAAGIYLIMRRNLLKLVMGLVLLSQAANLLIFTSAGLRSTNAPIIPIGATAPVGEYADPLPQALILTAIVIGFGVIAFTLALFHMAHIRLGTDDLDHMKATDT